jgi:putative ABC transport system substrate-binding protein
VPVINAAAASMRMEVSTISVSSIEDIERAFEMSGRESNAGMIVAPSGLMINNREKIATLAARYRVPAIYPFSVFAVSGGLVSYGPDDLDQHRQSAAYVDRILKGEKPADLPVQAPVKFELVINLKAAKALGLDVPYNLLILADRVID